MKCDHGDLEYSFREKKSNTLVWVVLVRMKSNVMHLFIKSSLKYIYIYIVGNKCFRKSMKRLVWDHLGPSNDRKREKWGPSLFAKVLNDQLSAARLFKAPVPVFRGLVSIGFILFFMEKIHFSF